MKESSLETPRATRPQVGEAAVWLALLRGPQRTERMERGFRRWLEEHPGHGAAFEIVSSAWEDTGALSPGPLPRLSRWQRAGFRHGALRAGLAFVVLAALAVIGALFYVRATGVTTDVGEQRMLVLKDGSRVFLNTSSRVVVRFEEHRRLVELKQGEALFEVAKKGADNPFVVRVGEHSVTALGTQFVVRRDANRMSVTLLEGRVEVSEEETQGARSREVHGAPRNVLLAPGQRVTVSDSRPQPQLDTPSIEKITAWRGGHVDLADVPLADAAAEMNRYSRTKILIEQPESAALRVTGIFRTGDSESFANAIAETYGLHAVAQESGITLTGRPKKVRANLN